MNSVEDIWGHISSTEVLSQV